MRERTAEPGRRRRQAPGKPQTAGLAASMASLQGAVGNAGMAALARKPAAATEKKKLKYKPYALTSYEEKWDYETLVGHAQDAEKQGDLPRAAALYEKAYELKPRKDLALNIYRIYKKLEDTDKAEHWLGIAHGKQDKQAAAADDGPPVEYQQI